MFNIQGLIERRLLINFRLDPAVARRYLPAPFRPQLVNGQAIVGICLIRLSDIRPPFLPSFLALRSENAAHRFAVEWETKPGTKRGVFIPRRDTSSWINTVVGGRIFPGVHHLARFSVQETEREHNIAFECPGDGTFMKVVGAIADSFPPDSIFGNIENSSAFFKLGSLGYSPSLKQGEYQGLELITDQWSVKPFEVHRVETSFFSDDKVFPAGSLEFDHALLMRDLRHSWRAGEALS